MPILPVQGRTLEYAWIDPAAAPAGTPAGTLVFLHEGLGSLGLWRDFPAEVCRRSACRGLVYSRWGHGRSERRDEARSVGFMHEEAQAILPALLDALDVRSPILVGHSDGASIAIIHAATAVDPPRAIILEAPHLFVEDLTVTSIAATHARFANGDLRARLARHHGDNVDSLFRTWSDVWLSPAFRSWNIEEYVPRVTCPTLIVQGLDDEYGTLRQVEQLEAGLPAHVPRTRLLLDDCGHSPHVDQREAVAAAMAGFIADVVGSRPPPR
jgi:pimeloyl-ACP methyl ester carboxylesterase